MTIPDAHKEFFKEVCTAGAEGRLGMIECQVLATGAWATALVVLEPQENGQAIALPFALIDPDLLTKVAPPEDVQEVYE
jgi:hypothetical protein